MRRLSFFILVMHCLLCSWAVADEAICQDPNAPDGMSGTWVTRFKVTDSIYGPMVNITFLGYKAPGQANPQEYFPSSGKSWRITYQPVAPKFGEVLIKIEGDNQKMYQTPVATYFFPIVTSPNGRCSMFPVVYKYRNLPGLKKVALIGDSISWGYNDSLEKRQWNADFLGWFYQRQYHAVTEPGQAWFDNGSVGANLADEARGLATDGAHALVFHLGTNDAGLSTLGVGDLNATDAAIWQTLTDVNQNNRCLILVTPSDYPYSYIGGNAEAYRQAAIRIGNTLRFIAGLNPNDNVHLVDWAAESRSHNGPNGDWFSNGDYIHPNETGRSKLFALWSSKLTSCKN